MSGTGYVALPTPVTANPEFWNQGLQGLNALRDYQAKQATAQIYQQSIDPSTGQVDQGKFNALLAANPRAAWNAGQTMQQQGQAQGAQAQAGTAQVAQASAIYNMAGTAAASLMNDPSDENIARIRSSLTTAGAPPQVLAELDNIQSNPDPAQRKLIAYQHTLSLMDAQHRMAVAGFPVPVQTQMPQGLVTTATVPPSPYSPGGTVQVRGGVQAGVGPGQTQEYMFQPTDASGKPSGAPYKVTAPAGTVFPSMQGTAITPISPPAGAPGLMTPGGSGSAFPPGYTGRGVPPPPNAALTNPNKPPAPSPAPTPPPAATPAPVPAATTPPPPATPAPVQPPVSQPPGAVAVAAPMGTEETLNNDIKARTEASLDQRNQQNVLQAGTAALDALRLAKGYTGPGTGTTSQMYAFLQAHDPTGALPQGTMTDTAWRQVLAKNLLRFAQNSGLRGNTDLGLTEQLKGSANVDDMLPTANEEVLVKDIGRQRQRVAQTALMPSATVNGDVVNHFKTYSSDTDPRGFSWDLLSQPERDAIEAEVKKSGPAAVARLTKAIHDGIATGVTKPPSAPAASTSPAGRSTTGMVQPNPLIQPTNYAAATPNALAA